MANAKKTASGLLSICDRIRNDYSGRSGAVNIPDLAADMPNQGFQAIVYQSMDLATTPV